MVAELVSADVRRNYMSLLMPDFYMRSVTQITPDFLKEQQILALLLDVDNTLAVDKATAPPPEIIEWIEKMKRAGVQMRIVSNAKRWRIAGFAGMVQLPFSGLSCKPLPFQMLRAVRALQLDGAQVALVGDQIFTDILGGRLCGVRTILVEPMMEESGRFFKIKRRLERRIKCKLKEY